MSKYLGLWKANPALWRTDPKQALLAGRGSLRQRVSPLATREVPTS